MNNLHFIELSQYERPLVTEETNRDWVGVGEDNAYYQGLIDCFMDSTTNQAVITGIAQQIYGRGLEATDAAQKPEQFAEMKKLLKPDVLRKISLDLKMLGEAALQISYKGKKVHKVTHFPRETLRPEKCNENGDIEAYYYSADWSKVRNNTELTKIPVFGSKGTGNEVKIIKRYVTGYHYISPADYSTSYATLEKEIADYLINDAQNSFSGTKVINFNSGIPSEEKMQQIKSQVMNKLTGSFGEKCIIAFNHNAEQKTTVEDIPLNDAPQHYQYLSEECSKKILLSHRVTSPLLLGLRDGNSGLGSNSEEIENAQRLFSNTTIRPYQDLIIDCLDEVLAVNDISLNLYFKTLDPLEFMDIEVTNEEVIEEETGVKQEDALYSEIEMMANKSDLPDDVFNAVLDGLHGEVMSEEWEVADERDVDNENESLESWAGSVLEVNFAESVKSDTPLKNNPEGFSYLDKSYYKVRYKYAEGSKKPKKKGNKSRPFCEAMMARSKRGVVYRIEDIDKASSDMNFAAAKLPMHNGQKYNLFELKGGVYCRHKWKEVLYKMKIDAALDGKKGSKKLGDYDIVKDIPKSYRAKPRGHKKASKAPVNMPKQGAYPTK